MIPWIKRLFLLLAAAACAGLSCGAPIRFLVVGDSITQGGCFAPGGCAPEAGRPSYREPLIRLFGGEDVLGANPSNKSYSIQFVGSLATTAGSPPNPSNFGGLLLQPNHEGHFGWRADEILNGFEVLPAPAGTGSGNLAAWLSGYTADVVLIHIGTNDALQNAAILPADPSGFADETWPEIAEIVTTIQSAYPAASVFLGNPIPISPFSPGYWQRAADNMAALNAKIASSVSGTTATLVDFSGFNVLTMLLPGDPVHPNETGENFMAARWFSSIESHMDSLFSPQITSLGPASATVGAAFNFTITATNNPTSFGATGLPPGLSVDPGSGVISGTPMAAGIYGVSMSAANVFGSDMEDLMITVSKGTASVTLSDLSQVYDGLEKSVTVTTSPTGLAVAVTYDGAATPPIDVGSYAVSATVNDPDYVGTANGTLIITKATQTILFEDPGGRTFGEPPVTLTATSSSGLPVSFAVLDGPGSVSGNLLTLTAAGIVEVRASQAGDSNYLAAPAVDRSVDVAKAPASLVVSGLSHVYDGAAKAPTVTTTPIGLNVLVVYEGLLEPPRDAGNYVFLATIDDANRVGNASATLQITKAPQSILFADPGGVSIDVPVSLSATASSGLPVSFSVLSGPATVDGAELNATGAGTINIRAAQPGDMNYLAATNVDRAVEVAKATAMVTLTGLFHVFDGSPKEVGAVTDPAGLRVAVTYDGDVSAPSAVGTYAVVATVDDQNFAGSSAASMRIFADVRLANLSTRVSVGTGSEVLIPGFVIFGGEDKKVLIRAVGPSLDQFGVEGDLLQQPVLTLRAEGEMAPIATNTGWSTAANAAEIESIAAAVGAFPLSAGSADSAMVTTLAPGAYTAEAAGVDQTTGLALIEVYDADPRTNASRLVNISARARVGVGSEVLIPGLVVDGAQSRTVLIRGIGPSLESFGVEGFLADPRIVVFDHEGKEIAQNDDWSSSANVNDILSTTGVVGAFPLETGTKDAVVLLDLEPGVYPISIAGVGDTTGVALMEIYDVP